MNQDRRDRLRDAAIAVLAREGGRGLTHRAVDEAAAVPTGTAKNYFPTRDALLRAAAERCAEHYHALAEALAEPGPQDGAGAGAGAGPGAGPADAAQLAALLAGLLRDTAGPGRTRVLAYLELQAEAARRPGWPRCSTRSRRRISRRTRTCCGRPGCRPGRSGPGP